jgi:hypothetical protein
MAKSILDDELWALIEPLLPPPKPIDISVKHDNQMERGALYLQ